MLFCIFVKKQGSMLLSSNGRVKLFSLESRKMFVKKQPHPAIVLPGRYNSLFFSADTAHCKKFKKGRLYLRGETRSIWFVPADTKLQIRQGFLKSQFQTLYLIADTKKHLYLQIQEHFFCIRADTKRVLDQSSITVGKSFPRDMLRPPFETGLVHTGQIEKTVEDTAGNEQDKRKALSSTTTIPFRLLCLYKFLLAK